MPISDSRPRVVMVSSKGTPEAAGSWPMWQAATCRLCSRIALTTSEALMFNADLGQPAQGRDGQLQGYARGGRLLADVAGGNLPALLPNRTDDVGGAHVQCRSRTAGPGS